MKETVLRVQDMSCGHCVATVQTALEGVDGVESAEVSLDTRLARVSHAQGVSARSLLEAVKTVGFTPELSE